MCDFKDGFQLGNYVVTPKLLGKGSYGQVYLGYQCETKQRLAVKSIISKDSKNPVKIMKNEVSLLQKVKSPNIVKIYDVKKNKDGDYFIFLEYCESDLKKEIERKYSGGNYLEQGEIVGILRQICDGYKVLYQNKIIHRDIKPENILTDKKVYKIADFGFGRIVDDPDEISKKTMLGSPIYTAPQILKREGYSAKCDIWSLGILLFQLLYYRVPFDIKTIEELRAIIPKRKIVIPSDPKRSNSIRQLLENMLQIQEKNRIDWPDLFCHEILEVPQELGAEEMSAIQTCQKVLNYYKNICMFLSKVTHYFGCFRNSLHDKLYFMGMHSLSCYIIYLCKSLIEPFFSKKFPHESIDQPIWSTYKQTMDYWRFLKELKMNQTSLELYLEDVKPVLLAEIVDSDDKLLVSVKEWLVNNEAFSYERYCQSVDWLCVELRQANIEEVMVRYFQVAKNPLICFGTETDFGEVERKIETDFKMMEYMS